ncbi:carbon-nitrogen hydrolase [Zychaea mexicana]|uniref:carbon-nitrogen hydrolase n=1 Tax=Zychaea mexicana TaxID=64656 RepID=UPI0022FE0BE9|nr:carbon-nitrogen hydrolase [Zychaea mexicana]KAI9490824.1 carbon-nitrogen hydrolase [Zychaea mexicana]
MSVFSRDQADSHHLPTFSPPLIIHCAYMKVALVTGDLTPALSFPSLVISHFFVAGMKIAAVQYYVNHEDRFSNWDRITAFVEEAAKEGVDLLVFPEYSIGGPVPMLALDKSACERYCQLALTHNLDIVAGTIVERDPDDGQIYNCCYYISNDGTVLMEYRKVHLWHPERDHVRRGNRGFGTVKNRFGITVGLAICWDIAFPEIFRHMAMENNAQLIIAPAYWVLEDAGPKSLKYDPLSEVKFLDSVCTARAFENEICMVFCNAADAAEGQKKPPSGALAGCTQITVPFKGCVAHCKNRTEEMIIADIDVHELTADAEANYKIRKDWAEGYIFGGKSKDEVETIIP